MKNSNLAIWISLCLLVSGCGNATNGKSARDSQPAGPLKVKNDLAGVASSYPHQLGLGGDSSGGGPGVLCRSGKSLSSVDSLDLYEAKLVFGREIPEANEPIASQLGQALDRLRGLDPFVASDVLATLRWIHENSVYTGEEYGFPQSPDDIGSSWKLPLKDGCEIHYIGYYQKGGKLLITTPAYQKLSRTHKAAFFLHEALYSIYRDRLDRAYAHEERNSEIVRQLVGLLLTKTPDNDAIRELLPAFIVDATCADGNQGGYCGGQGTWMGVRPVVARVALPKRGDYFRLALDANYGPDQPYNTNASLWMGCITYDWRTFDVPFTETHSPHSELSLRDVGCSYVAFSAGGWDVKLNKLSIFYGANELSSACENGACTKPTLSSVDFAIRVYNQSDLDARDVPEFQD